MQTCGVNFLNGTMNISIYGQEGEHANIYLRNGNNTVGIAGMHIDESETAASIKIEAEYIITRLRDLLGEEEIVNLNALINTKIIIEHIDGTGNIIDEQSYPIEEFFRMTNAVRITDLTMNVSKFIPYNINEAKGVILQTIIEQSNLNHRDLPIKDNTIEIEVPSINNIKPTEVKVVANSTKATNGDETGVNFTTDNYTYDETTNKLTINVKNEPNEQGKIAWYVDTTDEFIVTYIYPKEAITQESIDITLKGKADVTPYVYDSEVTDNFKQTFSLDSQTNNLVDFSIATNISELGKGQLYTNYQVENKKETEYQETITADVGLAEITDKIVLEQNVDNFVKADNTKSPATQTYYKKMSVDKTEFDKILGNAGTISIYSGDTKVSEINAQTLEVDLSTLNINSLRIETSKPQTEGKLNFKVVKAIKGDSGYTKADMTTFNRFEVNTTVKAVNGETNFVEQTLTKEITLKEPTSQAELVINNSNLSTLKTNENVKITAVLKTDTLDCNLYTNPTLQITLPSCIENINIKNVEALFDTETSKLTVKSYDIVQNLDGTKTIVVNLEGTQTEYTLGAVSKGVNVVITSDITVNKLTANKQEQMKMAYTNNNVIVGTTPEARETALSFNIVAPVGVVATNSISNYAEGQEKLLAVSGEEKTGIIEINAAARTAKFDMTVINNYNSSINTISVLGRIAHIGNKSIIGNQDLGTTFTMPMQSEIVVTGIDSSKVKVYYSENGEVTKDVTLASNAWTTTPSDLSKVKSYCIVIENYEMNTADKFNFSYMAQIPENLTHNQSAYETYAVYFNNEEGTIEDKVEATKIGITTGKGAIIEATMSSNIDENTEVLEGKVIKYKLTVNNTGTHIAENVKVKVNLPKCMSYIIEDTSSTLGYKYSTESIPSFEFGNVEGGKSITKDVWVKVGKLYVSDICQDESHYIVHKNDTKSHSSEYTHDDSEYTAKISVTAEVTADNIAKPIQSTKAINTITRAYFTTSVMGQAENGSYIKDGATYLYRVNVKSTDRNKNRENTKVTVIIPEELKYEGIRLEQYNEEKAGYEDITNQAKVEYNDSNKTVTVNIGSVNGNYAKELYIRSKVQSLPQDIYEKQVEFKSTVIADNVEKENIDTLQETIYKVGLKVTQSSNIPENSKIATNEDFKYIFTIENLSKIPVEDIVLTDILPKEVQYVNGNIIYSDEKTKPFSTKNEEGNPEVKINLGAKQTARIEINVVAKLLEEQKTIQNKAKIVQKEIGTIETNTLTHTINAFTGKTDVEVEQSPKRISGLVWIDSNKDGIRDESEQKVSNVQVMLLDNTTGSLILDGEGNTIIKTTDEKGMYTFENVSKGSYTVIFLYDTGKYSATSYQVKEAGKEKDCDAIDTKITMDGQTKIAAITETVNVTVENVYNIDLGIVENPKFDLKIDKTVGKMIVQNSTGTTEYNYNDSKLAKKELVSKYVDETTIVVEYKIKVTNEGAVDGYVKKIADYIPAGLKFNAELNRDWYSIQNGVVLNSSLANTKIAPGESKEVILILTMDVSQDSLGLINNRAEIYEAYNELGLEDIDSKTGNQASDEDDISSADILITIKTGKTIMFIGLSMAIIATIGIGAYFIKKKVLR